MQDHPNNKKNQTHRGPRLSNGFTGDHFDIRTSAIHTDTELAVLSNERLLQLAHEHFRPYKANSFVKKKVDGKLQKVQQLGLLNINLLPRLHE